MYELCSILVSMMTLHHYKVTLKKKGHSYRSAAPLLGVHPQSLYRILNAKHGFKNRRVLAAIPKLPAREKKS